MAKSKKAKKKKGPETDPLSGIICRNRKARHDYEILEELECGIVLKGSEIKSLRNGKVSINDAYARVEETGPDGAKEKAVWLLGADIAEYPQANVMNHEPRRPRKLLLKKKQITKFAEVAQHDGLTLVPLDLHFHRGYAKVQLAVGRGLKKHDNREKIKRETDRREMRQALRTR